MNITVVYGTEFKGTTYNIAQQVINNIKGAEVQEIFLPRDLPEFCQSCFSCFINEKGFCTHSKYTAPIREKLLWADLIILTSPTYSAHVSGQMKVFLDHFANMWLFHRPEQKMFSKQGIVIATATGTVYKNVLNEMKDSLDFWGVAKTYKIGAAVYQPLWDDISPKIKSKLESKVKKTAEQVQRKSNRIKPCLRVRKWFFISRAMKKFMPSNPPDAAYWEQMGWTKKARPWKDKKAIV